MNNIQKIMKNGIVSKMDGVRVIKLEAILLLPRGLKMSRISIEWQIMKKRKRKINSLLNSEPLKENNLNLKKSKQGRLIPSLK